MMIIEKESPIAFSAIDKLVALFQIFEKAESLDPGTGVNKSFENVSYQRRIQKLFQGGSTTFRHFFKRSFLAKLILSNLSHKNDSGGPGACSPGQILKICILFWPF